MNDSGAWLAAIVESSDDAIIGKTLQGVITSWNPGAERLFGHTAAEAIGQPIAMLVPPERSEEEPGILRRIARGERVHHFETVRLRKDGSRVAVSVTISPVRDEAGRIVGASKIARDIGERQRAEARLQAQLARLHLLDQVTRAIGEHQDLRSIYQVALRSVEDRLQLDLACILGLDAKARQLVVDHVGVRSAALAMELALTEQGRLEIDANGLRRCIGGKLVYEADIATLDFPFPRRLARGGLRSAVLSPLQIEGRVAGIVVAARREPDAFSSTDCEFLLQLSTHVSLAARHAQLHASLQKAFDELRASQQAAMRQERLRALGQMASGIAHDINNLVFPATAFTSEVLENDGGLSAHSREQLQKVVGVLDDVGATVRRLREFYRPREVREPMAHVRLNPVVRQVVSLVRPRCADLAARGVKIDIRTDLRDDVPAVLGSEPELREALVNLVFNALDAMPSGGALVVSTACYLSQLDDPPRPAAVLAVRDSGIGMDDETRRRCLDPFYTTKGELGTGMGLPMVYGTVQRHNAEIAIDSVLDLGTAVTLRFPPVASAPSGEDRAPSAAEPRPRRALRILVIDDDPLVLETLQHMLQAGGHVPHLADGGQMGIDSFRRGLDAEHRFDLVLTDLGMPGVDGHAVAQKVKQLSPATPVILLTGWGEGWLRESRPDPAIDVVMNKPPRLRELNEAVGRLAAPRA